MQNINFIPVNSPSAKDTKDGSACESPYSQSVFTRSLCSLWNTRHLTELRLFDSIFLLNLQGNKELFHLSGVPVKFVCLRRRSLFWNVPYTRAHRLKQPHCTGAGRRRRLQLDCL